MESVICLSSCSVVLRYLVSSAGAIHGEFPLRRFFSIFLVFARYADTAYTTTGVASTAISLAHSLTCVSMRA